jgi:hypothetical protein
MKPGRNDRKREKNCGDNKTNSFSYMSIKKVHITNLAKNRSRIVEFLRQCDSGDGPLKK